MSADAEWDRAANRELAKQDLRLANNGEAGWYALVTVDGEVVKVWATDLPEHDPLKCTGCGGFGWTRAGDRCEYCDGSGRMDDPNSDEPLDEAGDVNANRHDFRCPECGSEAYPVDDMLVCKGCNLEYPIDYEACAHCGHDHAYEPEPAKRWHDEHPIPEDDGMNESSGKYTCEQRADGQWEVVDAHGTTVDGPFKKRIDAIRVKREQENSGDMNEVKKLSKQQLRRIVNEVAGDELGSYEATELLRMLDEAVEIVEKARNAAHKWHADVPTMKILGEAYRALRVSAEKLNDHLLGPDDQGEMP